MARKHLSRGAGKGQPRGRYDVEHREEAKELQVVRDFRANVRTLLIEAKKMEPSLTQAKVAKKAGMSVRSLAGHIREDSESVPSLRTIHDIAQAMGVEPWQLLFPDFPAQIALNPSVRSEVRNTIQRYLNAEPAARPTMDNVASILPQRAKTTA